MPSLQFIVLWCLSLVGLALPPLTEFDLLMLESRQRATAAGFLAYGLAAESPSPPAPPAPGGDAGQAASAAPPPAAAPSPQPRVQYYYPQPRRGLFGR